MPAESQPKDDNGKACTDFDSLPPDMKADLRKIANKFEDKTDRVKIMDSIADYFVNGLEDAEDRSSRNLPVVSAPDADPAGVAWESNMVISDFWHAHPVTRGYKEFPRLKQRTRDKITKYHETNWDKVYNHNDWDAYAANLKARAKTEEESGAPIDRLIDYVDTNVTAYVNSQPTYERIEKLTEDQKETAIRLLDIKLSSEITRKQYVHEAIRSRNEMTIKDIKCAEVLINHCDRDYFMLPAKSRIKIKGFFFSVASHFSPSGNPALKEQKIQDLTKLYDKEMDDYNNSD